MYVDVYLFMRPSFCVSGESRGNQKNDLILHFRIHKAQLVTSPCVEYSRARLFSDKKVASPRWYLFPSVRCLQPAGRRWTIYWTRLTLPLHGAVYTSHSLRIWGKILMPDARCKSRLGPINFGSPHFHLINKLLPRCWWWDFLLTKGTKCNIYRLDLHTTFFIWGIISRKFIALYTRRKSGLVSSRDPENSGLFLSRAAEALRLF